MSVDKNDPARAHNRTVEEIRLRGAIFNINEGIEVEDGENCSVRLVGWPGNGTRMVSFHVITHRPGGSTPVYRHPMSEKSIICLRGRGEVNLGRGWVEVGPGNVIYVPHNHPHATRNAPGSEEDFIILAYACPPPMDFYEKIGLFRNRYFDQGAIDQALLKSRRGNIPSECVMRLNDLGGDERAEVKGVEEVKRTGGIFHIFKGAPYEQNIAPMRFVLWPGAGTRMLTQHTAFHPPRTAFGTHYHPISEDAVLFVAGTGYAYLESRWIECTVGDILYAPAMVRHGTGGGEGKVICSGCACPPQYDLYEHAGYLKDGVLAENVPVNYPADFLEPWPF